MTKTVTIVGTVDGQTDPQLTSPYAFITVLSDGSNWYKIAESVSPSSSTTTPSSIILYEVSGTFTGNLGGRSGADSMCAGSANKPGGYSNFAAFLSVSADDEIRDMPTLYSVPTGVAVESKSGTRIANDWFDLLDASIAFSLGDASVLTGSWFSGANSDGSVDGSNTCNGWTDGTSSYWAKLGRQDTIDTTWLYGSLFNCSNPWRVLCIAYEN